MRESGMPAARKGPGAMTSRLALGLGLLALLCAGTIDLEQAGAVAVRPLSGRFHHVQGIDVEHNTLWVSSVDADAARPRLTAVPCILSPRPPFLSVLRRWMKVTRFRA